MEMVSTELLEKSSDNILWKNCIHYEDNEAACLLGKHGYRDNGIVSSPLFQVLSVTLISNNGIQDRASRIYGTIWLTTWNCQGVITHVYDRSVDDPELVKPCYSLKLQDHVFVLTTCHVLHLELFVQSCSDNAISIAISDQFVFYYTSKDYDYSQNKKITMGVDSNYSFEVICATFPFAVVAKVRAIYFCNARKDDKPEYIDDEDYWLGEFDSNSKYGDDAQGAENFDANVFGEISASIYDHFGTELNRHIPVTLLNRSVHEKPIKVKSGYFIKLSRSVLVVPSYSTLKVNVNIWDHNKKSQISVGVAKFLAQHDSVYRRDIVGENGYVRIRLHSRLNISIAPKVSTCYMDDEGDMLLEVFSVVIFSYYDDEEDGKLCVHGKIVVDDYQDFIVYKRDEDNPLKCCSSGTIVPIVCATRSLTSLDYVSIIVLLNDKEGGEFIEGGAHWNGSTFIGMYDKSLCSIIRGELK